MTLGWNENNEERDEDDSGRKAGSRKSGESFQRNQYMCPESYIGRK